MVGRLCRRIIRRFDAWLLRASHVWEFTQDPECVCRVGPGKWRRTTQLPDGTVVQRGEPILVMHLWNEHLPPVPSTGHDVAWGLHYTRQMQHSIRLLARYLHDAPDLVHIQACHGVLPIPAGKALPHWERALRHLGFLVVRPERTPWQAFTSFWENLYTWGIIWTYNPVSLTRRQFGRMVRCHLWLTRKGLLEILEREVDLRKPSRSQPDPLPPQ